MTTRTQVSFHRSSRRRSSEATSQFGLFHSSTRFFVAPDFAGLGGLLPSRRLVQTQSTMPRSLPLQYCWLSNEMSGAQCRTIPPITQ
eukprot:4965445-Amphidinium_carterae.1